MEQSDTKFIQVHYWDIRVPESHLIKEFNINVVDYDVQIM